MDNQRNFIMAAVLSLAVVFFWQMFVISPRVEREKAVAEQDAKLKAKNKSESEAGVPVSNDGKAAGSNTIPGASAEVKSDEKSVGRVPLTSDKLHGSINLRGARIDDLRLAQYHEKVDKSSPEIQLLKSVNDENAYFVEFGFSPNEDAGKLPGPGTVWSLVEGKELSPDTPIVLEFKNDKGLVFSRRIYLDDNYMFTISDTVKNGSQTAQNLKPYGRIARYGSPKVEGIYVLHEGLIGNIGDQGLDELDYDEIQEDRLETKLEADSGWLGITDKYWATALIPTGKFIAHYNYISGVRPFYQTDYLSEAVSVPAGGETVVANRLFAGAKKVDIIDEYMDLLKIPNFDQLIDWGWFYFLTKPMFTALNWVFHLVGNFGVAILVVTVLLKLIFFPLANKSYKSMANMKKMQPEMTAIRERFADDKAAQQKAMMELYKTEGINPAAGCWPVLIQIPVFFALYKVLYVTIEMRHAPFFGWIKDLSAPDPTSILNLFGLMPWDSPAALGMLAVGVWPLIMGITMFIQMQMNPAPPDPTQQMIFKWMPVVFTFMLATFPAGLVIYWAWNNTLSIIQQGAIMKKQGAKIELWDNLKAMFAKKEEESSE